MDPKIGIYAKNHVGQKLFFFFFFFLFFIFLFIFLFLLFTVNSQRIDQRWRGIDMVLTWPRGVACGRVLCQQMKGQAHEARVAARKFYQNFRWHVRTPLVPIFLEKVDWPPIYWVVLSIVRNGAESESWEARPLVVVCYWRIRSFERRGEARATSYLDDSSATSWSRDYLRFGGVRDLNGDSEIRNPRR